MPLTTTNSVWLNFGGEEGSVPKAKPQSVPRYCSVCARERAAEVIMLRARGDGLGLVHDLIGLGLGGGDGLGAGKH